jgi:hypothetical protein
VVVSEFLSHYAEILTDPAHLAVEITLMLLVDGIFLGLLWPLMRRALESRIRREHLAIDAEHGIEHSDTPAIATRVEVRPRTFLISFEVVVPSGYDQHNNPARSVGEVVSKSLDEFWFVKARPEVRGNRVTIAVFAAEDEVHDSSPILARALAASFRFATTGLTVTRPSER